MNDVAGLRLIRKCRQTKSYVGLWDGIEAGFDTDGGRWQTICEKHGGICSHETYSLALAFLPYPLEWCEECRDELG